MNEESMSYVYFDIHILQYVEAWQAPIWRERQGCWYPNRLNRWYTSYELQNKIWLFIGNWASWTLFSKITKLSTDTKSERNITRLENKLIFSFWQSILLAKHNLTKKKYAGRDRRKRLRYGQSRKINYLKWKVRSMKRKVNQMI